MDLDEAMPGGREVLVKRKNGNIESDKERCEISENSKQQESKRKNVVNQSEGR